MDALLSGNCPPEEAPAELRPVAEVLATLQLPPDPREVAGWGAALTEYREMAGRPGMPGRPRSRRSRSRSIASLLSARLVAAAGAAAIAVLGGGAAAAYTGSLPTAMQKFAHAAIAAPGVHERSAGPAPEGTGHLAGPPARGRAADGLCNAYQHAAEHGNASQRAVAFRNLVKAAGGAGQVAAYCGSIPHPGPASLPGRRVGQTASATDTSHGKKPTAPPGKPTAPPGKPTSPPGKPTTAPGNGKNNGHGTQS
ncbi:MAG: hypothetical protein ACRDPD_23415 [Streptosporangiaceae bacterium]